MIELITGLPGNGKTLYTISTVMARARAENRQVYYHGIPELSNDWILLEDPREWAKCPPNSIVVIDEAQKIFRNRSLGSAPPQYVTELETHRHLGIDIVMITQHPSLIDPAVRRLSGRHQHLIRVWGLEASTVHRWDSVKDNCDKSRSDSEKTKWAFDKSVYKLYKSAEVHTVKRSIPGRVKLLVVLALVFVAVVFYVVRFVASKASAPVSAPVAAAASVPGSSSSLVSGGSVSRAPVVAAPSVLVSDPLLDAREYAAREHPRVAGLPHTAPKYDQLTVPVRVPVPAMCIQKGSMRDGRVTCRCYTQQATPMDVDFNMCLEMANHGFFQDFDAERERKEAVRADAGRRVADDRYPDSPPGPAVAVLSDSPPAVRVR